jgi:nucleotide-binding universal stress UspA family protein
LTLGADLEAVIAWETPPSYGLAEAQRDPEAETVITLRDTVQTVFGDEPPLRIHTKVQEGNAARVLLQSAEGAQMLVVGSRGRGGFAGLLLGSVSASVAEHASCPVVVVHGQNGPPHGAPS